MKFRREAISKFGRVITGKTPPTHRHDCYGGPYLFVTPSDLEFDGFYCRTTERSVTEEAKALLPSQFIPADSVMFTCIGATIGKCGLAPAECLTNQQINSVVPNGQNDARFLYYAMRYSAEQVKALGGGAATPIVNKSKFEQIEIPRPSVEEQRDIASILSGYDELIENNRRRMVLLEDAARQLYREWFVRLRFPGHEHTKMLDGVPEGWERVPLEAALVLQRGFDLPIQDREEGDIPVYGSTGIAGFHSRSAVKAPGVVTGRSGTLGEVHFVAQDYWPLNTALWVREFRKVSPAFATFLLREMDLKQYNGGASVPTLDRKSVHRVEVTVPSAGMVALFDDFCIPLFHQMETLKRQNECLRTARDLLLPRLMSGELAV